MSMQSDALTFLRRCIDGQNEPGEFCRASHFKRKGLAPMALTFLATADSAELLAQPLGIVVGPIEIVRGFV